MVRLIATEGLDLFDLALGCGGAALVPVKLNLNTLRRQAEAGLLPAMLRGLVRVATRAAAGTASEPAVDLRPRLSGLNEAEQLQLILDLVRSNVAAVLGHATSQVIDAERGFLDMGLDSLTAVELRNRMSVATGLRLPATTLFDYPTPTTLAEHLRSSLVTHEIPGSASLLVELRKLEAQLTAIVPDTRAELATRLQDFLVKLTGSQFVAAAADAPGAVEIESATDDDLFDYIDNDLGLG